MEPEPRKVGEMEGRMEVEKSVHEAAILGDVHLLDQVLERDPLILDRVSVGSLVHTPLHVAAFRGHLEFVRTLLSRNPHLAGVLDLRRRSALHLAAAQGHLSVVKELVQANPHMCTALDADGRNPLHLATIKGDIDVLIAFFKAQPHRIPELLSTRDVNDDTVLHLAVQNLQFETLEHLLHTKEAMEGKPINAEQALNNERALNTINKCGFTPLDILGQTNKYECTIEHTLRAAGCLKAREINQAEWLSKKRQSLMVVASLIATMTFQAALSPPGGYWQDNNEEHKAGENVMAFNRPTTYSWFLFANSMGFLGSLTTILLLVTGLSKNSRHTWLLVVVMFLTVVSTLVAYTLTIQATTSKKDRQPLTDCVVIVGWTWCVIMMVLFLGHLIWLFTKIKTRNAWMEAEKKVKEIQIQQEIIPAALYGTLWCYFGVAGGLLYIVLYGAAAALYGYKKVS